MQFGVPDQPSKQHRVCAEEAANSTCVRDAHTRTHPMWHGVSMGCGSTVDLWHVMGLFI